MGRSRTATPGRKVVRLELTEVANERINAVCDARAMVKNKLVERVLTWFAALDEPAQTAVIRRIDKGMGEAYAKILRRLADEAEGRGAAFQNFIGAGDVPPSSPQLPKQESGSGVTGDDAKQAPRRRKLSASGQARE